MARGHRIYTVNVVAFGQLRVNVFLVVMGDPQRPEYTALIDAGSSERACHEALQAGLVAVREQYGEAWSWQTLSRAILTHPHPDHAGGWPLLRPLTPAPLAAHRFALPYLQKPAELCQVAIPKTEEYLRWTGISDAHAPRFRARATKWWVPEIVEVDTTLRGGEVLDNRFEVLYCPGHQVAQVCLRLDEVLFSADQLLPLNLPPLMPEWLAPGHGLGHYLASLDKLEALEGVDIALGGHDRPMLEWRTRIQNVRQKWADKQSTILEATQTPRTVQQVTDILYPNLKPLHAVLLLDQTAAIMEYMVQHGQLRAQGNAPRLYQQA